MRALKTATILLSALALLFISGAFMTDYYPAARSVVGPDGSPLLRPDGTPALHRDMVKYYRVNRSAERFVHPLTNG